MYGLYGLEVARVRREEMLREAEERRFARALREGRGDDYEGERGGLERVRVRWGLAEDEPAVADLLELNGMPRWVAFEERFVVAEEDGRVIGAVRYRTESKRLLLGLLVVDPWAGEGRLAKALYAGAGDLARGLGVGEVVASEARAGYPSLAGYLRWGRDWRLDTTPVPEACDGIAAGGWRRVLSLFGELPVPFHRYR
ncbi:MAG: GNAT family N-acetyltransferase [Rubrobacter sp.]